MNGTNCVVIDKYKKYKLGHQARFVCKNCGKEFYRFFKQKGTYCSIECQAEYQRGRKLSEEHKKKIGIGVKMSDKHKVGISKRPKIINSGCFVRGQFEGEKHPFWRGGTSNDRKVAMGRKQYRDWRKAVLLRNENKCVWCGATTNLEVDHKRPWALFPEDRYDVVNGRTLCHSCHQKTSNYGGVSIYNLNGDSL